MEKLGAVEVLEVSMVEEESKKGGEARGDGGGKKDGDAAGGDGSDAEGGGATSGRNGVEKGVVMIVEVLVLAIEAEVMVDL